MSRGLPKNVSMCLEKALDSALLSVEIYNKPATKFKSSGFIVLMCIAWTSLFHAIFFKRRIKPYYREKNKKFYKKVNGEYQFWELKTSVEKYFIEQNNPMRVNIEFFIPLRNKIEHKFLPVLDPYIFAECQSLLMNFDKIVEAEFGEKYCLRESLSFALQLYPSKESLFKAIQDNIKAKEIYDWVEHYRSMVSPAVYESGEYSFKAFLIQVANHKSVDALPIQFYSYDKLSDIEKEKVNRIAALVKPKYVDVINKDLMKPMDVVKKVQLGLGEPMVNKGNRKTPKFSQYVHTLCWKKYRIRPASNSATPENTNSEYCIYDKMNQNYGYTQAWVDFLIEKMSDEDEYNSILNSNL